MLSRNGHRNIACSRSGAICGDATGPDVVPRSRGATVEAAVSVVVPCEPADLLPFPILITQSPNAQITAQGRIASRMGATPMATSHGHHPNAAPPTTTAPATSMMPRMPRSHVGR